jgi:hypothetical protein
LIQRLSGSASPILHCSPATIGSSPL